MNKRGASFLEYIVIVGVLALGVLGGWKAFGASIAKGTECQATQIASGGGTCAAASSAALAGPSGAPVAGAIPTEPGALVCDSIGGCRPAGGVDPTLDRDGPPKKSPKTATDIEGNRAWLETYVNNGSHRARDDATPQRINWDGYPGFMRARLKKKGHATLDALLVDLGSEVRGWLGPYCEGGFVCRHNAHTAVNLLNEFKKSGDFPVLADVVSIEPWRADSPDGTSGHRWVRLVTKDGTVYHFDPMNQIIYKLERKK